jgi:hypothetical protein
MHLGPNQKIVASPFWHYEWGEFKISPAVVRRLENMIEHAVETFGVSGVQTAWKISELINMCFSIDADRRPSARIVTERLKEIVKTLETVGNEGNLRPGDREKEGLK